MRLYVKCLPEYFALLDKKGHEFRQIECIIVENSETKETREFLVTNILRLDAGRAQLVRQNYPKVPWDAELPVFAIELGEEVKIERAAHTEAERDTPDSDKDILNFSRRKHEH